VATFTLGLLLTGGVEVVHGIVLGAAAFASQAMVAPVIARRLERVDRACLALGQQNGVTAIILALSLQPSFPRAVGIVAPAIVTVNVLHTVSNALWLRTRMPNGDAQASAGSAVRGLPGESGTEAVDGPPSPSVNSGSRTPAGRTKRSA
jgi:hypothetical protein